MQWKRKADCLLSTNTSGVVLGIRGVKGKIPSKSIILTEKLEIDDAYRISKKRNVVGVIVRQGSFAGHTAGLLNSTGVQLAICPNIPRIPLGTPISIDGEKEMVVAPGSGKEKIDVSQATIVKKEKLVFEDRKIKVFVDGKNENELLQGIQNGATGVGILRTDWFGAGNTLPPSTKSHYDFYIKCVKKISPVQLNIRLFDIGGGKLPSWTKKYTNRLASPLGERGIGASKLLGKAFSNQLEATNNVSKKAKIGVIIPMVTDEKDVLEIKEKLNKKNIILGAMIETPSSVIRVHKILPLVDFVRIGPGDLSQFCLARLRKSIKPCDFSGNALHPAVLELIKRVVKKGNKHNKKVDICLDVEPRTPLLKDLLRIGINTFCVSPNNVGITIQRLLRLGLL